MIDDTDDDVSSSLRTALRERPGPPPTWNLDTVKARGRRRRHRARLVPVAVGLVVVTGVGVAASTGTFARLGGSTTTTVAAAPVDAPEEVVRGYLAARMAGDNMSAYYDYRVDVYARPGLTANYNWTATTLDITAITVGVAEPCSATDAALGTWAQVVCLPISYQYVSGPGLTGGKFPYSGLVVLVRNSDTAAWRILALSPEF